MEKPLKRATLLLRMGMLLWMLCISLAGFCQQATVTGHIVDNTGEAAIGATVLVKGTTEGTVTDIDGNFRITVKNIKSDILVISYVGYETQEIRLQGKKQLNVTLAEVLNELQEVTVVAYGVQKKETLTGAISSVKTDALLQSPNSSVANSLAGKITGLSSVQSSGQPGSEDPKIFIRGVGSLTESGGTPLILVDGVERSFFQMDPNEIENVTVLKDASATAVFGVRGANGVVLITTKSGSMGKSSISYDFQYSISSLARKPEVLTSQEYLQQKMEEDPTFTEKNVQELIDNGTWDGKSSTDWYDVAFNPSSTSHHTVNFQGANDRGSFFLSLNNLYDNGIIRENRDTYKRLSVMLNADYKIKPWLKVGVTANFANYTSKMISDGSGGTSYVSMIATVFTLAPYIADN